MNTASGCQPPAACTKSTARPARFAGWLTRMATRFLSLLRHGNWLSVATARGLYCGEISQAGLVQLPTAPDAPAQPHPRPATAASINRRPIAPGMVEVALGPGSTIPLELSLEGNADAAINLTAERKWKLKDVQPGTVQLSLSELKNESHYVFFQCPGYATRWIFVRIAGGKVFVSQTKVELFRKRYVILRCAVQQHRRTQAHG